MGDGSKPDETTHYKWQCKECGTIVWLPIDAIGSQIDHTERPFCECNEQGIRMTQVSGPEGNVSL